MGSAAGAFIPRSLTTPYSFTGAGGVSTGFFRFTDSDGDITQALFTPTQVSMSQVAVTPVPARLSAPIPGLLTALAGFGRRRAGRAVAA